MTLPGNTGPIPDDPGGFTPELLTRLLHRTGALPTGKVTAFGWTRIGEDRGYGGICARITLTYTDAPTRAPATLVLKLPNAPGTGSAYTTRLLADPERSHQAWERAANELLFYETLAPFAGVSAPKLWFGEIQENPPVVVLGLEDIHDSREGDALTLSTPDEVEAVLREIAGLHALGFTRPDLRDHGRLPAVRQTDPVAAAQRFARDGIAFRERYGARIPAPVLALVDAYAPRVQAVFTLLAAEPMTLVHGDLHLDNILFRPDGTPVIIDWPGVGRGSGLLEAGRFLYASLPSSDRRAHETRLCAAYVESLATKGGPELSPAEVTRGFRLGLLHWFHVMTVWLGAVDGAGYSGRERAFLTQILDNPFFFDALIDHGGPRLVEELV